MKKEINQRIEELINKMTIDEKIGQLHQSGVSIVGAFEVSFEELINMLTDGRITPKEFEEYMNNAEEDFHEDDIRAGYISSFNGVHGSEKVNRLQKIAVEESRLGIPLLIGADIIHGCKTTFPIPLAESCCWDEKLWEKTAEVAADEDSSLGIAWTFAPMIDVARDPRWGRISEGAGEDPYLVSKFAVAKVKGFQGEDLSNTNRVLACAKHFVAYGACEGGRDYNTTDMSLQKLHEVYLPPFKAAVKAGCQTIMPAFNDLNGIPCSMSKYLLKDILRDEYEFDGMLISDANAIQECIIHGAVENRKAAALHCLSAGLDMDMTSNCYREYVKELIEDGSLSISELDNAVRNVLKVKFRKGLFDNPYITDLKREQETVSNVKFRKLAKESALNSIVLLKNDGILPLKKEMKIGVAGNLANDKWETIGAWAIMADGDNCVSVLEGIQNAKNDVLYEQCIVDGQLDEEQIDRLCSKSDVIIAVVGETRDMSGEASSRGELSLPKVQKSLLKNIVKRGKKVIAVLMNGRPLALSWEAENVNGILETWHLGSEMGNAVADILFGDFNPCGKLTTTFPFDVGQCPIYYNHPSTGRPAGKSKFTSKYLDIPEKPLYPFGYGLSYTTFNYENIVLSSNKVLMDGKVKVSVDVTNTGSILGEEIVQLYVSDVVASRARPVKELKGYKKILLQPGQCETVSLELNVSELGFYNENMKYVVEPGLFKVYFGPNSKEGLEGEFTVIEK